MKKLISAIVFFGAMHLHLAACNNYSINLNPQDHTYKQLTTTLYFRAQEQGKTEYADAIRAIFLGENSRQGVASNKPNVNLEPCLGYRLVAAHLLQTLEDSNKRSLCQKIFSDENILTWTKQQIDIVLKPMDELVEQEKLKYSSK